MAIQKKEIGFQYAVRVNAGSAKSPRYLPSYDFFYGPYQSVQDAFDALSTDKFQLCIGKTVGIMVDGKIVEYWFESAASSASDLVPKGKETDKLTPDQMDILLDIVN